MTPVRRTYVRLNAAILLSLPFSAHGAADHAEADQLAAEANALAPEFVAPMALTATDPTGAGSWGTVIPWTPHIPVTAATLPDGRLLTFASNQRTTFPSGAEFTYAAVWNPATGQFTEINNTRHDMFCGGAAMLPDGRVVINGGRNTTVLSSIFDYRTNQWVAMPNMNDPRWYNTSVALTDGSVFTVSGSGGSNTAERWNAATGWRRLTGIGWAAVTSQPGYINIWHPFLLIAPNGNLFHFGPTDVMNWVNPDGTGALTPSGTNVPGAHYPKEGAWAMYDAGKIVVAGGGATTTPNPSDDTTGTSTNIAYTVNLNGPAPVVTPAASMQFPRQFGNSVILPTGEVMVVGGNTSGLKFNDTGSVLTPELWNPRTGTWRSLANMSVPRNYHSVALLLPDGRVWAGGGGLSGNSADHRDAQIFTPPGLFNTDGSLATRPVIAQSPSQIGLGARFTVQASPGLARFTFIKMSAQTHAVNTDLRFLEFDFAELSPGLYELTAESNRNVLTPGYWMLFALDSSSVHSVSKVLQVTVDNAPTINNPGDQIAAQGASATLQIIAAVPGNSSLTFTAVGLPSGLNINSETGLIGGMISAASGVYPVTITAAANSGGSVSTSFNWTILLPNLGSGQVLREWWLNVTGATLANITGNAAYPANPTGSDYLSNFETPTDWADNLGQRVRGFLHAPVTGQYRFWIAGDDESRLLLSTTANPASAVQIARVPSWSASREWTKFPEQQSVLITLQAGQRYYIDALMKEGSGGDNLAVAWQIPGTSGPVVIPGQYLSPYQPHLNPVATWSFEEATWNGIAGEVKDTAGLVGIHGTGGAGVTPTAVGPALSGNPGTGRNAAFNGTSQYVRVPFNAALNTPDFTIGGWVKLNAVTHTSLRGLVVSRETVGTAIRGFGLYASTDGRWQLYTGSTWSALSGPAVVANQWTHIAATFRNTSVASGVYTGTRRLFVNGAQVAEDTGQYVPIVSSSVPMYLGASELNQAIGLFTPGVLDEVCIHASPLSATEIGKMMNLRHVVSRSPLVTNPGAQLTVVGSLVSLNVAATDPDGDSLTFSSSGLPPGLSISTSGVISGVPTQEGNFVVSVSVTDGLSLPSAVSFNWQIAGGLTLGALTGLPQANGANVQFTVPASNGLNPLFIWNFGDGSPDSEASASPSITHTFPGPGRYTVTVTGMDDTGRVVSSSFRQAVHATLTSAKPTASSSILYEPRATGDPRIWVVNPDNESVSVFNAVTRAKLAETTVGSAPRSLARAADGTVWVACAEGSVISILNGNTFAVGGTVTLPRGSRPFGLAFDPSGTNAWVTLEASGQLVRFDSVSKVQTADIDLGPNIRHVSVSHDGSSVFVSRFITPPLSGESTATVDTTNQGGEVIEVDANALVATRTILLAHSDEPDTTISGSGIPNYLGAAIFSPDNLSAWVPSKQDNITRGKLRNGQDLTHESSVRAIASRIDLGNRSEDYLARVDFDNAGMPSAVCFDPWGIYAFTTLESSRAVAVIDVWNQREIVRFPAGRAPQGLTISPDGLTLYVHNFMDRTVSLHDVSAIVGGAELPAALVATLNCVATEKLSAQVLKGKQFFYDAKDNRLALQEYIACASCHNDGAQDGRTWDFTGFGEGLRNTITLRGHGGTAQGSLHWTGNFDEVQDFENQIRNFAGGTGLIASGNPHPPLGTPNAGRSADLDALAAYLGSLATSGASPARTVAASLPPAAVAGRTLFKNLNCANCHSGAGFTNSALNVFANIGTIKPTSGQRLGGLLTGFDVPTLRGLWSTGPYLHDGSAPTLLHAVRAHAGVAISDQEAGNLAEYLKNIDDQFAAAPVRATVTLTTPAAVVSGPFTVTATFNQSVTGFDASDVIVSNSSVSSHSGSGASYTFLVSPTTSGAVTIGVPANVASDLDGDGNAASASLQVTSNRLPTIVQPATQDGKTGDIVSFQISAADPEGAALAFAATGLPSGLSIDAASGLVSGEISISAAPTSNVVVTVSDGVWSVNASFTWNVTIGTALPAPWAGNDIGAPGLAGNAQYSAGVYTVEGGGADIWNSSDQFNFVSRQFTGNGEIIARVTSQSNTDPWAKAGVMLRETSQENSRHAMMVLTPGNGTAFQYRATTGGVSATVAGSSATAPNNWVRLVRNGNLISGYRSTDGVNWTQVGSANISMASVISVGLAVTSRNNGVLSTATFNNVQVNPSTLPAPWIGLDIGTPNLTEIDRYASGAYRVSGGGSDIYSTSDSFHFIYQPLIGDGRITARVSSQTNTNAWAKAGVMFRDGLQANAKNAALFLTPSNGFAWQRRTAVGGATTRSAASSYTASNNWIRIIRKGNNFTAYRSSNGTSWSKISSVNITMTATVYVGFAVTACDNTKISEGVFDNVQVIDKP